MRLPRAKEISVRFDPSPSFMNAFYDEQWLQTLASCTALITSLDLTYCDQLSDDGLRSLDCLTVLTSLDLSFCDQVTDEGLPSLAGLTALTSLDLNGCEQVSADGLRSLDCLAALTKPPHDIL